MSARTCATCKSLSSETSHATGHTLRPDVADAGMPSRHRRAAAATFGHSATPCQSGRIRRVLNRCSEVRQEIWVPIPVPGSSSLSKVEQDADVRQSGGRPFPTMDRRDTGATSVAVLRRPAILRCLSCGPPGLPRSSSPKSKVRPGFGRIPPTPCGQPSNVTTSLEAVEGSGGRSLLDHDNTTAAASTGLGWPRGRTDSHTPRSGRPTCRSGSGWAHPRAKPTRQATATSDAAPFVDYGLRHGATASGARAVPCRLRTRRATRDRRRPRPRTRPHRSPATSASAHARRGAVPEAT